MANDNVFDVLDQSKDVDLQSLSGKGEVHVRLLPKFVAKKGKNGGAVIELVGIVEWCSAEEDKYAEGRQCNYPIFLDNAKPAGIRTLKDFCQRAGANKNRKWGTDDGLPLSVGLPGVLRLCCWQQQVVVLKTRVYEEKTYATLHDVVRVSPVDGTPFDDAIPNPISDELIKEAVDTPLDGDKVEDPF